MFHKSGYFFVTFTNWVIKWIFFTTSSLIWQLFSPKAVFEKMPSRSAVTTSVAEPESKPDPEPVEPKLHLLINIYCSQFGG